MCSAGPRGHLHGFVDDAPIWFDEGHAEFYGHSRRSRQRLGLDTGDFAGSDAVHALRDRFVPLEELFLMRPPEFMADADARYAQAGALVLALRKAEDPPLAGLLDRYLDALLAGLDQGQAYTEVLAPLTAEIQAAVAAHLAEVARHVERRQRFGR